MCVCVSEEKRIGEEQKKGREESLCRCAFVCSISVCVCERATDRLFVCVGGAVRPGCRYHPSPCHRPKGCWESGRQLHGSDNGGCILIFPTQNTRKKKTATLLPHHPVRKTINPHNLGTKHGAQPGPPLAVSHHHPPAAATLCMNSTL